MVTDSAEPTPKPPFGSAPEWQAAHAAAKSGPISAAKVTGFTTSAIGPSGQTAPWSIQARKTPTCASVSFSDWPGLSLGGGMSISSMSPQTMWTSELFSLWPGTMVGPWSVSLKAPSLVSQRYLPFCFCAPWQEKQDSLSIGYTSCVKSTLRGTGKGIFETSTGLAGSAAVSADDDKKISVRMRACFMETRRP